MPFVASKDVAFGGGGEEKDASAALNACDFQRDIRRRVAVFQTDSQEMGTREANFRRRRHGWIQEEEEGSSIQASHLVIPIDRRSFVMGTVRRNGGGGSGGSCSSQVNGFHNHTCPGAGCDHFLH